jgi:mycothiol synthase
MRAGPSVDEIESIAAPAVQGVRFRRIRLPDDYAGMVEANQAMRESAGRPSAITIASLTLAFEHLVNCDLDRDVLIAERDGRIIGYARVWWRDQVDGDRVLMSVSIVRPEDRHDVGQAMLTWAEDRLAAIAPGLPDGRPAYRNTFTWGTDAQEAALLTANGWTERGRGYEMLRPTLDDIPDVPLPDGFEVRVVGDADRRQVWDASVEAFRDHRMEPEPSDQDWQRFVKDGRQDLSLWVIGFDGTEVAGASLGLIDAEENLQQRRERGIVDEVFTRRPWRRRGLARALVARTLVRLHDRGMTSASLSVDGLNPNQAMTLYESLGFEVASVEIDWIKPVPGPIPIREEEQE